MARSTSTRARASRGSVPRSGSFRWAGARSSAKWLKDRKGRRLFHDELMTYQRTMAALKETIQMMAKIFEMNTLQLAAGCAV